jgi:hypothetical protein
MAVTLQGGMEEPAVIAKQNCSVHYISTSASLYMYLQWTCIEHQAHVHTQATTIISSSGHRAGGVLPAASGAYSVPVWS